MQLDILLANTRLINRTHISVVNMSPGPGKLIGNRAAISRGKSCWHALDASYMPGIPPVPSISTGAVIWLHPKNRKNFNKMSPASPALTRKWRDKLCPVDIAEITVKPTVTVMSKTVVKYVPLPGSEIRRTPMMRHPSAMSSQIPPMTSTFFHPTR